MVWEVFIYNCRARRSRSDGVNSLNLRLWAEDEVLVVYLLGQLITCGFEAIPSYAICKFAGLLYPISPQGYGSIISFFRGVSDINLIIHYAVHKTTTKPADRSPTRGKFISLSDFDRYILGGHEE